MVLSYPTLLFFLLLLLQLLRLIYRRKTELNPLPGPRPLPVIGNLHQLGPIVHRSLYELSKVYGPLFQLNLGRVPIVVVSSPSVAKQVLKTYDLAFCSRPTLVTIQEYSFNGCDIASAAYGSHWRNLRKIFVLELFNLKKLRSFIPAREEETERMIQSIKSQADSKSPVNITEHMILLANNIVCRVSLGHKGEGEYGEKSRFHGILEEAHAIMASFFAADFFPGFGWIDTLTGQMRRLRKNSKKLDDFYQEVIDQHLKDGEKKRSKEDIVDVMLRLWREGEQLSMDHIKGALMNIIIAGTDTSAATVIWAMAELAKNPTVMKKAQDAVREVIGKKRKVVESDLPQLQYLKCVLNETLRLHPPLPLLVPRETTQHCKINGYDIGPKTRVLVNSWAIGRDKEEWENPENFNPDRFIGSSVDYKGQDFQFIPFGAGRRICPGMNFGIATTELALANLLYAFNWELPTGMKKEDIDMYEAPGFVTHKKSDLCLVAINS